MATVYLAKPSPTWADLEREFSRIHGKDVELVRHVRTPEGAKRFKRPIGSPIGNRELDKAAKAGAGALKKAKAAESKVDGHPGPPKALTHHAVAKTKSAAAAEKVVKVKPKDETAHGATRSTAPGELGVRAQVKRTIGEGDGGSTKLDQDNGSRTYLSPKEKADAQSVAEKHGKKVQTGDSTANVWQLSGTAIQKAIDDPATPPAMRNALKVEKQRRLKAAAALGLEKKSAEDYIAENIDALDEAIHEAKTDAEKNEKANIFLRGLYKVAPKLKPKIEALRQSEKLGKITESKAVRKIVELAVTGLADKVIGTAITIAFTAIGLHIFGGAG